jgi:hypothetical protein
MGRLALKIMDVVQGSQDSGVRRKKIGSHGLKVHNLDV